MFYRICPLLAVVILACSAKDEGAADTAAAAGTGGAGGAADTASRVATAEGFSTPESVLYDAEADAYFVSNINGSPGERDNNGFISRVRADGTVDSMRFIAGGRGGVTLNAPKGMALVGDTLWVTDIDAVRAFHR
ncbi:MAG: hypothetical protein ACREON_07655, partial [Gemmatimonadaceae bacterium]